MNSVDLVSGSDQDPKTTIMVKYGEKNVDLISQSALMSIHYFHLHTKHLETRLACSQTARGVTIGKTND